MLYSSYVTCNSSRKVGERYTGLLCIILTTSCESVIRNKTLKTFKKIDLGFQKDRIDVLFPIPTAKYS